MVKLKDGRVLTRHIEHAIGSLEKPMSDAALEAKFADLAEGILAKAQADADADVLEHRKGGRRGRAGRGGASLRR